jgi:hypothetical protein
MATSQTEAGGVQLLCSPVFSLLSTESAEAHIRIVFGDSYYAKGQLEDSEFRAIEGDFVDDGPTVDIVSDGSSDDEAQGSSKRQKLEEAGKSVHENLHPSAQATSSGITASQAAAVALGAKEPATAVNPGLPALQMCNHPGNQNSQRNGSHFHITGKNAEVYINDPEMKEATI